MARVQGVSKDRAEPHVAEVLEQQIAKWGTTLEPYEVYARRPSIFRAVIGMWGGLDASGLLDGKLKTLVNRRVAALNGCVF